MSLNEHSLSLEDAGALLKKFGLRKTISRMHLLICLAAKSHPMTKAEVSRLLGQHGFDSSTIFRGLTDLTSAGLIVRLDVGDRIWRFELHDDALDTREVQRHHSHAVCLECGTLCCVSCDTASLLIEAASGWQITISQFVDAARIAEGSTEALVELAIRPISIKAYHRFDCLTVLKILL